MPDHVNQEELLAEFWETVHKTYFRPLVDQDKEILTYLRTKVLAESQENGLSSVPVFMDEDSVEAVASMISSKYEAVYGPGLESLSKQNFANMTKQYYLSLYYYLPLLLSDKEVGPLDADGDPQES